MSIKKFAQTTLFAAAFAALATISALASNTKAPKPSVENFARYEASNKEVKAPPVAVFMGDSITDNWYKRDSGFFTSNNYLGRGIGGQVSCQMLARMRPDVIEHNPKVVLILAGTNDIAQNLGYISNENIVRNVISMCELAKLNNITPVICSVLPVYKYGWNQGINPAPIVVDLNARLKTYALTNGIEYLDYYTPLVDERGGLSKEDASDGVHPTIACYKKMEKMAKAKIEEIVSKKQNKKQKPKKWLF